MKIVKTLIGLLVVVALGLALSVPVTELQAQVGPNAITLATNRVTAATTNTTDGTAFFIGGQNTITVGVSVYGTNAAAYGAGDAAATFTLRFKGSQDGVTYYNDGTNLDVTITPGATNAASAVARLSTTSWQYLIPDEMRWPATNANTVIFPTAFYWYK